MRRGLTNELEQLHNELITMGTLAEEAIEGAINALMKRDEEAARRVIAGDDRVDDCERAIEQRCLMILARQQPLASDLRAVSAALKIITDLERISDQAADIGEVVLRLKDQRFVKPLVDIPLMASTARSMVRDALDAYIRGDLDLAYDVCKRDDVVDQAFERVILDLTSILREQPQSVPQALDLLFIGKYLERMADHATNIAEWAIYLKTGEHPQDKDVRAYLREHPEAGTEPKE